MERLTEQNLPLKPLVALVDHQYLHEGIVEHIQKSFSWVTVSLSDGVEALTNLLSFNYQIEPKREGISWIRKGILKTRWFEKRQYHRPGVVILFSDWSSAAGDPTSWAAFAHASNHLRRVLRDHHTRIVIAVLEGNNSNELPPDRANMIARESGIDPRNIVVLQVEASKLTLKSLESLTSHVSAQLDTYFTRVSESMISKHKEKTGHESCFAVNARTAIKLAAVLEASNNWGRSVSLYDEALQYLLQIPLTGDVPIQLFIEIRTIAELVHTRSLFGMLRAKEDVAGMKGKLKSFLQLFGSPPIRSPPEVLVVDHSIWKARQHEKAAELFQSVEYLRRESIQQWIHAVRLRELCRASSSLNDDLEEEKFRYIPIHADIYAGRYVLTSSITLSTSKDEDLASNAPTDSEIIEYLRQSLSSQDNVDKILQDLYRAEQITTLGKWLCLHGNVHYLLGKELMNLKGQESKSRLSLMQAAETFRRQGWHLPLSRTLLLLEELASRLGDLLLYCSTMLEAATLPVSYDRNQNEMAKSGLDALTKASSSFHNINVRSFDDAWNQVIEVCVGIRDDNDACRSFVVAFRNHLPVPFPLSGPRLRIVTSRGISEDLELDSGTIRHGFIEPREWRQALFYCNSGYEDSVTAVEVIFQVTGSISMSFMLDSLIPRMVRAHPQLMRSVQWGCLTQKSLGGDGRCMQLRFWGPDVIYQEEEYPFEVEIVAPDLVQGMEECSLEISIPSKGVFQKFEVANSTFRDDRALVASSAKIVGEVGEDVLFKLQFDCQRRQQGEERKKFSVKADVVLTISVPFEVDIDVASSSKAAISVPTVEGEHIYEIEDRHGKHEGYEGKISTLKRIKVLPVSEKLLMLARITNMSNPTECIVITDANMTSCMSLVHCYSGDHLFDIKLQTAGDMCSLPFLLYQDKQVVSSSLGTIEIRWRRTEPIDLIEHAPRNHKRHQIRKKLEATDFEPAENVSRVQLPPVKFERPLLTAAIFDEFPAELALGKRLFLQVKVESHFEYESDATVALEDTPNGFLSAGPRSLSIPLSPGSSVYLPFELIAYHAGPLKIPSVIIQVEQHKLVINTRKLVLVHCGL